MLALVIISMSCFGCMYVLRTLFVIQSTALWLRNIESNEHADSNKT